MLGWHLDAEIGQQELNYRGVTGLCDHVDNGSDIDNDLNLLHHNCDGVFCDQHIEEHSAEHHRRSRKNNASSDSHGRTNHDREA